MKKINEIIISEKLLLQKAIKIEEELCIENSYSTYHSHVVSWYKNLECFLNEILGFEGNSNEEFIEQISSIDFTNDQIGNFLELKKNPLYKKALGLASYENVEELEDIIDYDINNKGNTFIYNGKKINALKTSEQLQDEENLAINKLSELFREKQISKEQWEDYQRKILYIYEYFISASEGELLFAPRISDSQYREMEQKIKISNIPFRKQLVDLIKENREKFTYVQRMQQEYYESNKVTKKISL